ncbi:MAG: flagellar filament capping protein FliD [Cellulomonas sp.]|jgi:flagellar hook-associated protein 2|nr:flagellar filament capping protein FliD [Cellulomonas sp.]
MAQVSGLVSGLDTASIINALMNVAKLPQMQLTDKKNDLSKLVTALQALNSKTASLADSAKKAADPASWSVLGAKVSSDAATASVRSNAAPTSVTFEVDKVAQSQISLSASFGTVAGLTGGASMLSLKAADGTVTEIDVSAVTSPADLAAAISRSDAGVAASVTSSTDASGVQTYRLQLTGKETGAGQAFSLYAGDAAAVGAGTATELSLVTARAASDAQVTLWAGTAAAQTVTSSTNTFEDLLTGLDVTVTKSGTGPVTIDVASDTEALTKLGSNLVSQLNQTLSEIATQTASKSSTDDKGNPIVTGGVLSGTTLVRMLAQDLLQAGSRDVNGLSPTTIGISVGKDGTFTIDEAKFATALAEDPSKVQAMLTGIADRVAQVATRASDKYDGTLTAQITSTDRQINDLGTRITSWDGVLELRRTALERQWASLETALQKLNSQSSWLTSMSSALSSLNSSSSKSSS